MPRLHAVNHRGHAYLKWWSNYPSWHRLTRYHTKLFPKFLWVCQKTICPKPCPCSCEMHYYEPKSIPSDAELHNYWALHHWIQWLHSHYPEPGKGGKRIGRQQNRKGSKAVKGRDASSPEEGDLDERARPPHVRRIHDVLAHHPCPPVSEHLNPMTVD
jgi:hypothetical protein